MIEGKIRELAFQLCSGTSDEASELHLKSMALASVPVLFTVNHINALSGECLTERINKKRLVFADVLTFTLVRYSNRHGAKGQRFLAPVFLLKSRAFATIPYSFAPICGR